MFVVQDQLNTLLQSLFTRPSKKQCHYMVINRLLLLQRYKHIYIYLFYSGQVVIHVIKIILRNTTNKPPTVIADYVKFNR